ncbi:UNVERIFIED_CONTAM: hypothetical protein Sradi_0297500 [Sesamum radiatum]|uniref:Serine aminopeptidase S33 domain-containing protein n=1 Tax=Sesamum radiatum TaxID=300843 RepID=A0AAW2W6R8_SESRA
MGMGLAYSYGMECSNFMKGVGTKLASSGYAVFGIDYEGHGRSMGARCYIKRFDNIVNDCSDHFKSICAQEEYREKRRFLYGESMGGAVALLTHKKDPGFWHGAILVAPMCKISEKLKPHPLVISLLTAVEDVIPKWKIVPTKDVIDSAFKDPIKREEVGLNIVSASPVWKHQKITTLLIFLAGYRLLFRQVTLPFFVLHGEADIVTDPEVSRALYEQASSLDKTIKLYPRMWHGLTAGEPDGNIEIVFSDIISWLDRRAGDEGSALSMKSIKYPTPSPTMPDGLTAMASPMSLKKQKHTKKRSHVKYLCGLKGRGFYHHSAV